MSLFFKVPDPKKISGWPDNLIIRVQIDWATVLIYKLYHKRMEWDPLLRNHIKELDAKKPVILCGDLNVAHKEIDLANPKTNKKSAGFTVEERSGKST